MLRFCFLWKEFRPVLSVTSNLVTSTYCQNAAATDFLVWLHQSVSFTHTFIFFQKPVKQRPAWFRDEKNILAIVPFGWYLTYPVYNLPWRRLWNRAKGGRCYHNYVVHNGSRRAHIDNNISENWLQKQILLCMAQSVSQILLEQFILAWAPLACSNTVAALCSTLWPQSVSHKKCWHIAEQVYFYPLFVLSLNHVTWK